MAAHKLSIMRQKKPHNEVILKLTFTKNLGLFSINTQRKVGFVFDNYVAHMVFIRSGCKDAKEFKEWSQLDNGALRNFEFMYCAAVRYCELVRKPDNFDRQSLKRALLNASKEQIKILSECILRSEAYGASIKKKASAPMMEK